MRPDVGAGACRTKRRLPRLLRAVGQSESRLDVCATLVTSGYYLAASVGSPALFQPEMPPEKCLTLVYPSLLAALAAFL